MTELPSTAMSAAMVPSQPYDAMFLLFAAAALAIVLALFATQASPRDVLYGFLSGALAGSVLWIILLVAGHPNEDGRRLMGATVICWMAGQLALRLARRAARRSTR